MWQHISSSISYALLIPKAEVALKEFFGPRPKKLEKLLEL